MQKGSGGIKIYNFVFFVKEDNHQMSREESYETDEWYLSLNQVIIII